jgi:hypothetical protein
MFVRAKFTYTGDERSLHNTYPHKKEDGSADYSKPEPVEMRTLKFQPVYGNGDPNHENTKFWNASPSGILTLGTINPAAWQAFELGKSYYLDFTPAE